MSTKNNSKKMSRQVTKSSQRFQVHLSDKALVLKVHGEALRVRNQIQTPSGNRQES